MSNLELDLPDAYEAEQDRICVAFAEGRLSIEDARAQMIATGLDPGIVDEGLAEIEGSKRGGA